MPKIKLDAVTEGMIVAADVKNMDDMLLIPAGCELTARHINILRTWGISEIQTEGNDAPNPLTTIAPEVLRRLQDELSKIFWNYDPNFPAQQEVFRLALLRRARTAATQGSNAA